MASSTALVIVEITEASKAPELKYVSVFTESIFEETISTIELVALDYLKDIEGQKTVKSIIFLKDEEYREIIKNQLFDYLSATEI